MVFPSLGELCKTLLNCPKTAICQSKGTISNHRLILDAVMVLWERRREEESQKVRFGLADSSIQAKRDWLMTSHDEIDIGMVVRLNDFVDDRIREQDCNVETHDASCHDTINNNIRRYSGTPQA